MDETTFDYDVAFSLLARDLPFAQELDDGVKNSLRTFLYARRQEELLGGDGMDQFARVFGEQARLTVILYRDGWGKTPWTAFEEAHIRDRALKSRMRSFMIVKLDQSELPDWVPDTHLYGNVATETSEQLVGIISARARQEGAVIHRESAVDYALRIKRHQKDLEERQIRAGSHRAVGEVAEEVTTLIGELDRLVQEIVKHGDGREVRFGGADREAGIADPAGSVSVVYQQVVGNSLRLATLRVNFWAGSMRLPSRASRSGGHFIRATHFVPFLALGNQWRWRHAEDVEALASECTGEFWMLAEPDESYSTTELAEWIVRAHVDWTSESDTDA